MQFNLLPTRKVLLAVYANYIFLLQLSRTCERFLICDDKITENDR